jgi:hypothetical protein
MTSDDAPGPITARPDGGREPRHAEPERAENADTACPNNGHAVSKTGTQLDLGQGDGPADDEAAGAAARLRVEVDAHGVALAHVARQ